jgi:ABC-2 type transport system ATP-binding protein
VRVGDTEAAKAALNGHVEWVEGPSLAVRGLLVAEVARRLVAAGVDVDEAVAERRTLEDVVLALTGPGSDRVDGWSFLTGGGAEARLSTDADEHDLGEVGER